MSSTAELRWFFDGAAPPVLERWFAEHAPDEAERSDRYLRLPGAVALGVKLRGGASALELKLRQSHEAVDGRPGEAAGVVEVWQKWSVGLRPWGRLLPRLGVPSGNWRDVAKRRRTATFAWTAEGGAALTDGQPGRGCRAELAVVTTTGTGPCSTLGLEAFGPDETLRTIVVAAADALLEAVGPLDRMTKECSYGYPAWLDRLS